MPTIYLRPQKPMGKWERRLSGQGFWSSLLLVLCAFPVYFVSTVSATLLAVQFVLKCFVGLRKSKGLWRAYWLARKSSMVGLGAAAAVVGINWLMPVGELGEDRFLQWAYGQDVETVRLALAWKRMRLMETGPVKELDPNQAIHPEYLLEYVEWVVSKGERGSTNQGVPLVPPGKSGAELMTLLAEQRQAALELQYATRRARGLQFETDEPASSP